MNVTIIGSGNVATILGAKILAAGHSILQIVGRNTTDAAHLANNLKTSFTTDPASIRPDGDIYIFAVPDQALLGLHEQFNIQKKLVVHTAGSISKDALGAVSRNYGVLYPLQSLHRDLDHLPEIPFLVDGNTPDDLALIKDFADTISTDVQVADDAARQKVHLAAVAVNNFVNHIYALVQDYCKLENLDFTLLLPLINETAKRLHTIPARAAQTGPAIRKDDLTIAKHLEILERHPQLREVYELMTRSIQSEGI